MAPDEKALHADLAKAPFRVGVADGRWRLIDIAWPHVFIAVTAKDGREYVLRFNCAGFPATPPTAGLWDMTTQRGARIRPLAAQQGRAAWRCLPSQLEGRHRALSALRPRKHRRPRQLARAKCPRKSGGPPPASFNTWSSSMNFSIAAIICRLLAPRHELSCSWWLWRRLLAKLRERGRCDARERRVPARRQGRCRPPAHRRFRAL